MQLTGLPNSSLPGFSSGTAGGANDAVKPNRAASLLPDPVPRRSDLLLDALSSHRNAPTLKSTGPVASLRARDAIRLLSIRTPTPAVSAENTIDNSERFRALKITRLSELADSLAALRAEASALRAPGALNLRSAKSSDPGRIEAEAGPNAPLTRADVTPTRLAAGEVLVSDVQADSELGFSGSFFINGHKVTVTTGDSLASLRDKINFGEDGNNNGALDGPEDLNGNGVLDRYGVDGNEFGGGAFVIEDVNGNGALDGTEDANGNGRLDGGVLETRVIAGIQSGRLTLTSLAGGDARIDLRDDDDVLLGLGFFERDSKGRSVQKEVQFDTGNPRTNLIRDPQTARIEVEGKDQTSRSNTFANVIDDTRLTLKQTSDSRVRIEVTLETSRTASRIESLVGRFNNAVRRVNDLLAGTKTFAGDADLKQIRQELTGTPEQRTRDLNERNENIDKVRAGRENQRGIGFDVENTEKDRVDAVALQTQTRAQNANETGRGLLDRLRAVGIRTQDDDTLSVNIGRLQRALTVNAEEVLDLFENPETGILPVLETRLTQILDPQTGMIALKQQRLAGPVDAAVSRGVRAFAENAQSAAASKLIAVV